MPTLRAILGTDMATTLCDNVGGVSIYVPLFPHSSHELAKIIGLPGLQTLCKHYKGEYITVPNGGVQKEQILKMLEQGKTKRQIALQCGVTERYVYMLASLDYNFASDERQLTLF